MTMDYSHTRPKLVFGFLRHNFQSGFRKIIDRFPQKQGFTVFFQFLPVFIGFSSLKTSKNFFHKFLMQIDLIYSLVTVKTCCYGGQYRSQ